MMFGNPETDIKSSLRILHDALSKKDFAKDASDKGIFQFVNKQAVLMHNFIQKFLEKDALFTHYDKKRILNEAAQKLQHLRDVARYAEHHVDESQIEEMKKVLQDIQKDFDLFSSMGVVYLFRHCNKIKRTNLRTGEQYDGIPTHDVKAQAMALGQEIHDYVLLSSKPVKIIIKHSEMERTRIFGEIVLRKALQVNHVSEGKVISSQPAYDSRIQFNFFTKEALAEMMDVYSKKGEGYAFFNWFNRTNEFATMKLQPEPGHVLGQVKGFLDDMDRIANSDPNHLVIVLGFSHSFIIDTVIASLYPGILQHIPVIKTAGFVKKECGRYCYLGKWV